MKRLLCVLLVLLLLFGGATPAKANSAQSYWEGVDQAGVIVTGDNCPIVVEHELLTFDLQEFPASYYQDESTFLAYPGKVTAQYTFYNPSAMTVTAKLLFPFGSQPWYGAGTDADAVKYDILVGGEPVEKKIRHTLSYGDFNLDADLPLVSDDFVEDPFYSTDLTVTAYKFTVSGLDSQTYKSAVVGFDIPKGLGNQRFYLPEQRGAQRQDNGTMRIFASAKNAHNFTLYVFGEPLTTIPAFKFYQDGGAEDSQRISGTASLTHTETLTFKEFALDNWSKESGVSEIDWYNATVADLNNNAKNREHPFVYRPNYGNAFTDTLMRWYEYEITLAPEQQIINTVTAPIYPSINTSYDPDVYGYNYLLSPASTWKSFGILDVVVNTPFYMTHCTLNGFEKTETGYKASFDGLPNGELYFEMSTSENPEPKSGFNWGWLIVLVAPFVLIGEIFEAIGEFFTNLFQNLF